MPRTFLWILLAGAALYGFYVGYYGLMQRRILFPRHMLPPAGRPPIEAETLWISTSSGQVEAWLLPPQDADSPGPHPALIVAHGNAQLIDDWPEIVRGARAYGLQVLLVEFPGYGRSAGSPAERSITEAFSAAYDTLCQRDDVDRDRILALGWSVGVGAACALAREREIAALLLISGFTSTGAVARGMLVPSFLVRDRFDNLKVLRQFDGPVLVAHGRFDRTIGYRHGLRLSRAARRGELLTYESGHNDCPPNWDLFWRDAESFLGKLELPFSNP